MSQVVDRFLQYVSFDTQSEEGAAKQPSTDKQWELARLLKQELEELGAEQVRLSEYGYIYAEIPSNLPEDQAGKVPALGFISHMDTAPALTGCNVKPQVVKNYDGHDICLNVEKQITMRISEFPFLERYKGQDLITTDGTKVGADANVFKAWETGVTGAGYPEAPAYPEYRSRTQNPCSQYS